MASDQADEDASLFSRLWDKLVFFGHFFKNPMALSTPMECSQRIANTVRDELQQHNARRVVELGSGVGSITRGVLEAVPPEEKLLCVEQEPMFCERLRKRFGDRIELVEADALQLGDILDGSSFSDPDALVCSVPLNTQRTSKLCGIIAEHISPQCLYLQISFTKSPLKPYFDLVRTHNDLFNIPPERVHVAFLRQTAAADSGADEALEGRSRARAH